MRNLLFPSRLGLAQIAGVGPRIQTLKIDPALQVISPFAPGTPLVAPPYEKPSAVCRDTIGMYLEIARFGLTHHVGVFSGMSERRTARRAQLKEGNE